MRRKTLAQDLFDRR